MVIYPFLRLISVKLGNSVFKLLNRPNYLILVTFEITAVVGLLSDKEIRALCGPTLIQQDVIFEPKLKDIMNSMKLVIPLHFTS